MMRDVPASRPTLGPKVGCQAETEPAGTQRELADLVAALADNKYFLGRRYAEWCSSAPTLESAVAAAAMAQDEIGHARSLYPVLKDLAGDSPEVEPETRTQFTNVDFLRRSFGGWTDFVAANFLFDTAISVLLEGARDSTSHALGQRARRILEEEPLHWLHGEGWTRRLAVRGPAVREALLRSFGAVAPQALSWFDVATPSVVAGGVLHDDPDSLRLRFREQIKPVLDEANLPTL